MVMMLFEIKTAFYKEKVIKREMQNLIMPRSNSMGSKTQQRSKTDKEVNETNVGIKGQDRVSSELAVERKILKMTCGCVSPHRNK